jgi:hypothetical protein
MSVRQALSAGVPTGEQFGSESTGDAGLAILENSTLGIVLKVPRATTGPDARIMDEYAMNVQAGTIGNVRKQ